MFIILNVQWLFQTLEKNNPEIIDFFALKVGGDNLEIFNEFDSTVNPRSLKGYGWRTYESTGLDRSALYRSKHFDVVFKSFIHWLTPLNWNDITFIVWNLEHIKVLNYNLEQNNLNEFLLTDRCYDLHNIFKNFKGSSDDISLINAAKNSNEGEFKMSKGTSSINGYNMFLVFKYLWNQKGKEMFELDVKPLKHKVVKPFQYVKQKIKLMNKLNVPLEWDILYGDYMSEKIKEDKELVQQIKVVFDEMKLTNK